jgi:hypothetical protein
LRIGNSRSVGVTAERYLKGESIASLPGLVVIPRLQPQALMNLEPGGFDRSAMQARTNGRIRGQPVSESSKFWIISGDRKSGSQWTPRWRKRDSNPRSPVSGSHRWNDRVAHGAASLTQPATASSPTSPARSVPRNARRGAGRDSHRERGGACSCASACMSAMSWSTVTTCSAIASTLPRARHGRRSSALRQRYHRH